MNSRKDVTDLDRIQRWMQSVITNPHGVEAGMESSVAREAIEVLPNQVETVIIRSMAQTSIERLSVYANAYYARLLEVMTAEFPGLVHALGNDLFQEFAFGYLQAYPSQSYTLSELGSCFPEHITNTRPPKENANEQPDWADFLIDLATLERVYNEVFDGPGIENGQLLQAENLKTISPDGWLLSRLEPVPCLRLLKLDFPVHEYITAVRHEEEPPTPVPQKTWLVVTRRDYVVRRAAVNEPEFAALSVLVDGGTIEECLETAGDCWGGNFEELTLEVQRWFREWTTAGYFAKIIA